MIYIVFNLSIVESNDHQLNRKLLNKNAPLMMIRIIEDDDKFESTAKNYQKKTKRWR